MRGVRFVQGLRSTALGVAIARTVAMTATGCGSTDDGAKPGGQAAPSSSATPGADRPTIGASTTGAPGASPAATAARTRAPAGSGPAPRTPKKPASYDPTRDITDLGPDTDGLRLDRPVGGVRRGELVVTIRNNGPAPVWGLTFTVEVPESMSADGGDWAGCTRLASSRAGFPAASRCDKGYLGVGASRVFRLKMTSPAAKDGADSLVSRWVADVWSGGDNGRSYRDRKPDDNRRVFSIYRG